MFENPKRFAQIVVISLLIIGCLTVIKPFIGAILFAFILWISTWKVYQRYILQLVGKNRKNLSALIATCILLLLLIIPTTFLALTLVDKGNALIDYLAPQLLNSSGTGLPVKAPDWLLELPLVGNELGRIWRRIATNQAELSQFLAQFISPLREIFIKISTIFANGFVQLCFVFFVLFFLFRDGEKLSQILEIAAEKIGGTLGVTMLHKASETVIAVMVGIIGTAVGQATVALLGFLIVKAPAPLLLAFATFFLSMIPIGPPIIWGTVAAWLYFRGEVAWAIFMILYGLLIISSIDNFVKPILMARSSGLSLLTVGLGVFGGIVVFGFVGIFLGPVLLALVQMLFMHWTGVAD